MSALVLAAAACGAEQLDVEATFDNTWTVVELAAEGDAVDLTDQPIEIEIDTAASAVSGRTNCQRLFGSYTLIDDGGNSGEASFTIPSPAASDDCRDADQAVHTAVVEALESVTQWRREASGLTLSSPTGSLLVFEVQTQDE